MTTRTSPIGPPDPPDEAVARTTGRGPSRRPLAAGHVIVVMVVASLVGSFLNAAGIRKTADGQPVGWRRDIARFFAEPLYDVSHAFRLDQFRVGVQEVAGRSGDDRINTHLPDPITPENAEPAPPITIRKREFSPAHHMKVWVGGDSLSITPGESFINLTPSTEVTDIVDNLVDGHIATGLARPEVFNWPEHMLEVIAQDQPDAVVLTLGSNDDQSLTGDGGVGPYESAEWITEYRRRVGGMMDAITANSDRVLFLLGVPPIRSRADDRYNAMNNIFREEAAKRPRRVVYIDLDRMFRGPDGGYADFINGVQVRTPDGVHFSRAGGDQIAQVVLDDMKKSFDLTSWRDKIATTTVPPVVPTTRAAPRTTTTK